MLPIESQINRHPYEILCLIAKAPSLQRLFNIILQIF